MIAVRQDRAGGDACPGFSPGPDDGIEPAPASRALVMAVAHPAPIVKTRRGQATGIVERIANAWQNAYRS
jgi:hypothetical protein